MMPNSTQDSEIILLTQKLAEHEKRIAALESLVAALEGRIVVSDDENFADNHGMAFRFYGDDDSEPIEKAPVPAKRGRRPRISPEDYARRRDELVQFIEIRWPDLVAGINGRKSAKALLRTIADASPGAESTEPYRQLTQHVTDLRDFLQSGRFKGEPRQIAYAMAGLPQIAWRTSLDKGTKNPSTFRILLPAFADHIRRRNRACFEALLHNGVNAETVKRLKSCCDDCRRLSGNLKRVRSAMEFAR